MIIEVNKDIENYKETLIMGLTAKQAVFSFLSLAVGATSILVLYGYLGIGLTTSCYIAMPFVAPVALEGFYNKNGMGFTEMMKCYIRHTFANRILLYVSTEDISQVPKVKEPVKPKKKVSKKKK